MKRILQFSIVGLLCIMVSCTLDPNEEVDEGEVQEEIYTSYEIGWKMQIPNGWRIISKDKMDEMTQQGIDKVEDVAGDLDYSGLKHLISFKKSNGNIFQSTSEPFKEEYEGAWFDNHEWQKDLFYLTYQNNGIPVDTSSSTIKIDGLEFEAFHIVLHGQEGEVILYQDVYGRFINGFDFGVILSYNNDSYKEEMMEVWTNSKFRKTE